MPLRNGLKKMEKKTIGIVGCGVIGSFLAKETEKKLSPRINGIVLFDSDRTRSEGLAGSLKQSEIAESMKEVIDRSDLVVEAATGIAAREILRIALSEKKDVMVMSVGGLLGNVHFIDEFRVAGLSLILPSGAIAGIDGLKSFKIAGIQAVTLTTRKSPKSIAGAAYLSEKGIDVNAIKEETIVFDGNAKEAVEAFPKNINVSALLSIAGIGAQKTKVKIVVSPEYTKNTHEIEITGAPGKLTVKAENVPSPDNPKTSYLAALSAARALEGYFDSVRIGT